MSPYTRDRTLDLTRGLIVALMALDHVRMYFSDAQFSIGNPDQTTLAYFVTRWVTHLCAPGFFMVAGMGAALMEGRAGKASTARFLLTRGLMLMALEFTVIALSWSFAPGWWWFGVINGLGLSMVLLAGLMFAPRVALLVGAAAFALLHDELRPMIAAASPWLTFLHDGGEMTLGAFGDRAVLYPILPWLALMVLGYAAAGWLMPEGRLREGRAALAGTVCLLLFVIARAAGLGEPPDGGFAPRPDAVVTGMAFLAVEKYPPSAQYALATLGLLGLISALLGKIGVLASAPLAAFGRTPLFFYLLHIPLIHLFALSVATASAWPTEYLFWQGVWPNLRPPDGYGVGLPGVYLAWAAVLLLLWPLCSAFGRLKRGGKAGWLRLL